MGFLWVFWEGFWVGRAKKESGPLGRGPGMIRSTVPGAWLCWPRERVNQLSRRARRRDPSPGEGIGTSTTALGAPKKSQDEPSDLPYCIGPLRFTPHGRGDNGSRTKATGPAPNEKISIEYRSILGGPKVAYRGQKAAVLPYCFFTRLSYLRLSHDPNDLPWSKPLTAHFPASQRPPTLT